MADALIPQSPRHPARHSRQLLSEIADVLGVPVEVLVAGPSAQLFHSEANAIQWFLVLGEDGLPVVRQVIEHAGRPAGPDEPITAFLRHSSGTAQGEALATLINHLLLAHMR